jgi:threonine dehydrogenase-like Zn-dependent dehydrogenase
VKALGYFGPSDVRVVDKPDPVVEDPADALVRVTRSGICGSDLHLYRGLVPDTRIGSTFGHEFTGVVEAVGPEVRTLKAGDRVVVPFNIACGTCFFCRRQRYASCDRSNPTSAVFGGAYGYSHTTGGYDGGQAELVRVPFADGGPLKIPDDMSDEDVLFLSDILPTGFQAAEMAEIERR